MQQRLPPLYRLVMSLETRRIERSRNDSSPAGSSNPGTLARSMGRTSPSISSAGSSTAQDAVLGTAVTPLRARWRSPFDASRNQLGPTIHAAAREQARPCEYDPVDELDAFHSIDQPLTPRRARKQSDPGLTRRPPDFLAAPLWLLNQAGRNQAEDFRAGAQTPLGVSAIGTPRDCPPNTAVSALGGRP